MSNSKLISYITSDFQTKSDMKVGEVEWEKIMNKNFDKFKKAGAVRQTVTQIWNKEGALRLGHLWEYKDEKSFVQCQKQNQIVRQILVTIPVYTATTSFSRRNVLLITLL